MSVRQSLLAILAQGPCYGYQLRHEFERRTGSTWPLNVGQIYNTLERLERDGLVVRGSADAQGHVYWEITDAGSAEVDEWLGSPMERAQAVRGPLALKIAMAATLPGADASELIETQRTSTAAHLETLRARRAGHEDASPEGLARALVLESQLFAVEAELRWLDHAAGRIAEHPHHILALELDSARPKRGRPARTQADAIV